MKLFEKAIIDDFKDSGVKLDTITLVITCVDQVFFDIIEYAGKTVCFKISGQPKGEVDIVNNLLSFSYKITKIFYSNSPKQSEIREL